MKSNEILGITYTISTTTSTDTISSTALTIDNNINKNRDFGLYYNYPFNSCCLLQIDRLVSTTKTQHHYYPSFTHYPRLRCAIRISPGGEKMSAVRVRQWAAKCA